MIKEFKSYAVNQDCSNCKYGKCGYWYLGQYFCKCKARFKKVIAHNCNKFKPRNCTNCAVIPIEVHKEMHKK